MILDKKVEVTIINHNMRHYKNLGYNVKYKDKIIVKVEELSQGSHYKINCKCDDCGTETSIKYQDYLTVFNKNQKYICKKCRQIDFLNFNDSKKQLMKINRLSATREKYGVDNVFQLEFVKEKMKETFIKKYGVEHFRQNEQIKEKEKEKRINNGSQVPDELLSEFQLYKRKSLYYTRKQIKNLYLNWNGLDYYDNELIKENKNLDSNDDNYPTIDHKISIKNGFKNNIEPENIGRLDNLCITKRCNNASKGSLYKYPKRINKYEKI
jgi:bifunctional DNA-binding transcriptional regulator/antitoxin component of YhaV-PrlF toxin-antitoxin module